MAASLGLGKAESSGRKPTVPGCQNQKGFQIVVQMVILRRARALPEVSRGGGEHSLVGTGLVLSSEPWAPPGISLNPQSPCGRMSCSCSHFAGEQHNLLEPRSGDPSHCALPTVRLTQRTWLLLPLRLSLPLNWGLSLI